MANFKKSFATAGLALATCAGASTTAFAQDTRAGDASLLLLMVVAAALLLLIIFIPTIIAFRRDHSNRWPILVVNLAFGGTGVGWLAVLIWALNIVHKSPEGSDGGESGLNLFVNDPQIIQIESAEIARPSSPDMTERLKRLKSRLDDGALSAEEYAALKKPLLDALLKDPSPLSRTS